MTPFELFYAPGGKLCLATEDRCHIRVKLAWAAPLTQPGRFLCFLDAKDKEIVMVPDVSSLPAEVKEVVDRELRRRYLGGIVQHVLSASTEFGATYWTVETDRGRKDFVTQSLQENAQWLGEAHLLLIDVDGNRFEIPDIHALDEKSQHLVWNSV